MLSLFSRDTNRPADLVTLSDKLAWMSKFGFPHLIQLNGGWHASIEMNTTAVGAKFEIKSEYGLSSADVAVDQCIDRLRQAVRDLGGAA